MVAYSFDRSFVPLIREGYKLQTIRGARKRHAMPGERLQLFCGLRTKQCFKIVEPDPVCTSVMPIFIAFDLDDEPRISRIEVGDVPVRDLDQFAVLDGFRTIDDMSSFWWACHGGMDFRGVVIEWSMPRRMQGLAA